MKKTSGFTMIELLVVITILGILAAFALPRFINLTTDARISSLEGLRGSLIASVALAHTKYVAVGDPAAVTVDMDGTAVACAVVTGYPTAAVAGMEAALQDSSGFVITHAAGVSTFRPTSTSPSATCQVQYTAATGTVGAPVTGGC